MMRRFLSALTMSLCVGFTAHAQVYIFNENMLKERMSEIKTTVLDSLTNEPVSYASVYVIPAKDTTITNFTLTDANGEAKLDEVPFGSYAFHVEMMGYKPVVLERFFREEKVDLGTIRLQVDEQFLQAAVVTDVGNPIVVKKDTVEFNASSFRVGANAMLKDLLQRMPGMEITDDGKVKFNGEEIDKLTVGGRTFFFGDQSTALNNLPAAVVDKIRVIDRESEQTQASRPALRASRTGAGRRCWTSASKRNTRKDGSAMWASRVAPRLAGRTVIILSRMTVDCSGAEMRLCRLIRRRIS